jgi:hypothetical protein
VSDRITDMKYRALIYDMLSPNPEDRPTATDILERLKGEDPDTLSLEETWREDRIVLAEDKFAAAGIRGLKKITHEGMNCYALRMPDGSRELVDADDLLKRGLATPLVEEIFDEPWEGHNVVMLVDVIKAKGYVACRRAEVGGQKRYTLFRSSGKSTTFTMENLINFGYFKRGKSDPKLNGGEEKKPAVSALALCQPWPEHSIRFNDAKIKAKGYIRVDQKDINGKKGYYFYKTLTEKPAFFDLQKLMMLQYARFVR